MSVCLILCMIFKEKFVWLYSINWTKFHYLFAFTLWDIVQYVYCNCLLTSLCGIINFLNFFLSNQVIFSTWAWAKIQDKNLNILRTKKPFKMKWKTFFIIVKRLSVKKIKKHVFLEGESLTLSKYSK